MKLCLKGIPSNFNAFSSLSLQPQNEWWDVVKIAFVYDGSGGKNKLDLYPFMCVYASRSVLGAN